MLTTEVVSFREMQLARGLSWDREDLKRNRIKAAVFLVSAIALDSLYGLIVWNKKIPLQELKVMIPGVALAIITLIALSCLAFSLCRQSL